MAVFDVPEAATGRCRVPLSEAKRTFCILVTRQAAGEIAVAVLDAGLGVAENLGV